MNGPRRRRLDDRPSRARGRPRPRHRPRVARARSFPGYAPPSAAHENDALDRSGATSKASATALVAQLRELDDTASKRTAEQLARERYALELRGRAGASRPRRATGRGPLRPRARFAPAVRARCRRRPPSAPLIPGRDCAASCGAPSVLAPWVYCSSFSTRRRVPRAEGGSLTGDVRRRAAMSRRGRRRRPGGRRPRATAPGRREIRARDRAQPGRPRRPHGPRPRRPRAART